MWKVELFDDRHREDLETRRVHPYLSELRAVDPLFVALGSRIPWVSGRDVLSRAFKCGGARAFVFFSPWSPGRAARETAFLNAFPTAVSRHGDYLVTSAASDVFPVAALDLREAIGQHNSGLWLLGSAPDEAGTDLLKGTDLAGEPITYIAERLVDLLGCCLTLDEGDVSTFYLKLNPATSPVADGLKAWLSHPS
jgi:hypothetical protein